MNVYMYLATLYIYTVEPLLIRTPLGPGFSGQIIEVSSFQRLLIARNLADWPQPV
jgi:hypothetical protein